ncbi:hypothetical protein SAMN05442782_0012 [Streptomyces sp. OK228]|nr:hypothetical protein SAMN05442782_0012 [Streptomyces sp. OK228]
MQEDPGHAEAFVVAEAVRQGIGLLVGDGALNEIQKSSRTFDGLLKSLVGLAVLGREFAQGGEVSNLRTDHDTPFLSCHRDGADVAASPQATGRETFPSVITIYGWSTRTGDR